MAKDVGILINPHTGSEHEYSLAHAWAIMDMRNNGGWTWKGEAPNRPGQVAVTKTTKKKGNNANNSGSTAGKAESAAQPEEDCGCH